MTDDGTSTRFQGVDKSSTAYRLLASMGWEEGQGLGAQKQGIATHVRVKRKADASGVGAAQEAARAKDWTLGMAAYDQVLATLKTVAVDNIAKKPRKKKQREGQKKAEDAISLETLPKLQTSDFCQEDADLQNSSEPRKKRRKSVNLQNASLTVQIDSQVDSAPQQKRLVTHVGRFQKVTKNKLVKGYSATDLAAILGANAENQASAGQQPLEQPQSGHIEIIRTEENGSDSLTEASDVAETGSVWWRGHFVKAGRSGSSSYAAFSSGTKRDVNVAGFSETDQANLWQNATDAQSKSKLGLGQGSALKIPAKQRWQGKKLKITDSDEEDSETFIQAEAGALPEAEPCEAIILPSKQSQAAARQAATDAQSELGKATPPTLLLTHKLLKWRKISRSILEGSGGISMPLKAFKAQAWTVAKAKGARSRKETLQELISLLEKSRHFVVGNKSVTLASAPSP